MSEIFELLNQYKKLAEEYGWKMNKEGLDDGYLFFEKMFITKSIKESKGLLEDLGYESRWQIEPSVHIFNNESIGPGFELGYYNGEYGRGINMTLRLDKKLKKPLKNVFEELKIVIKKIKS